MASSSTLSISKLRASGSVLNKNLPGSPKVIDLFAGVGGLSLGFEQAGFETVLANEFEQSIATSYQLNHPSTEMVVGDIRELDLNEVFGPLRSIVDVIIGGPPCQGFSQKGSRKTIHDERNFLFREFVEVVRLVRPRYFVMENVPNLLTNENGLFKSELISLFESLGYSTSAEVLSATDFGVPQNRRRAVIIGKLDGKAPEVRRSGYTPATVWDAISDLAYLESGEGTIESLYQKAPRTSLQTELRYGSKKLFNHVATKHSDLALERMSLIPPNCTQKTLPEEHRTKSIYSGTWTRLDSAGVAPTITTRFDTPSSGQFTHPYLNRALTVREAARLQTFPDTFKFVGTKMSQMKQVGNAVPPKLARAVASAIMSDIKGSVG